MKRLIGGVFALGILCAAGQAEASQLYEFTFSYSGAIGSPDYDVSGSGTLYATDNGNGTYSITGGSGTSTEAGTLTLLAASTYVNTLAPSVNLTSDNILTYPGNPVLDGEGIVFSGSSLPSNSQYFNIWGNGPGNYSYFNNYSATGPTSNGSVNFSVTLVGAVPEPASIVTASLGMLGVAAYSFARKRKVASV